MKKNYGQHQALFHAGAEGFYFLGAVSGKVKNAEQFFSPVANLINRESMHTSEKNEILIGSQVPVWLGGLSHDTAQTMNFPDLCRGIEVMNGGRSGCGLEHSIEHSHRRSFARTVGAKQRKNGALGNSKIQIFKNVSFAVIGLGKASDLNRGLHTHRSHPAILLQNLFTSSPRSTATNHDALSTIYISAAPGIILLHLPAAYKILKCIKIVIKNPWRPKRLCRLPSTDTSAGGYSAYPTESFLSDLPSEQATNILEQSASDLSAQALT
jgi:hypothetical protein